MSVFNATRRRGGSRNPYANDFQENPFNANVYFGDANNGWNQLGAMLGAVLGNNTRLHAEDRQRKKLDDYINSLEQAPLMENVNAIQTSNYNGATPTLNGTSSIDNILDKMDNGQMLNGVNYVKQQADMTPLEREKQRYKNLNADKITAWARENGVSQNVLDERLPALQKEMAANVGAVMIPQITQNLFSGDRDKILTGMEQVEELRKYDPVAYERYSRIADNQFTRSQNLQDRKELIEYQKQFGGSKSYFRISDEARRDAMGIIERFSGVTNLSDTDKALLANAYQVVNAWNAERGIGVKSDGSSGVAIDARPVLDPTNWDSVKEVIDVGRTTKGKEGKIPTDKEIYEGLEKQNLSKEMLLRAKNYMQYKTPEDLAEEKAKREKETKDTLSWGGRGNTNTIETPLFSTWGQTADNKPILNKPLL